MLIYFLFFIYILSFSFSHDRLHYNRTLYGILFVLLGLFLCTGYMVGSDWRNYELDYAYASSGRVLDARKEWGYVVFRGLFAKMNVDFWHFHIFVKLLCYFVVVSFLTKYSKNKLVWGLLFLFSHIFLHLFINCPFRNLIASSILLIGIYFLFRGRRLLFLFFSLLASSFHYSIAFLIPFVYFFARKKEIVSWKVVGTSVVIIYLLFIFYWQIGLAEKLFVYQVMLLGESKSMIYLMEQGSVFSIGIFFIFLFYLWIIKDIKPEMLDKEEKAIYNLSFLYIVTLVLSMFIPIVGRFSLPLSIPFGCLLSFGIAQIHRNKVKKFAVLLFVLFLALSMRGTLTKDSRYIPYSSYLQYIGQVKPSFAERLYYNDIHSPYKSKSEGVILME